MNVSATGEDLKGIRVQLEPEETRLVRVLLEQMLELLGEGPDRDDELAAIGIAEEATKSDDPVLARLFPDAYQDDAAAGEFRRYTEMGLRDGKRDTAIAVLEAVAAAPEGADLMLDQEQTQVWLRALNDVRLALGTRLDITEEWYEEVADLDSNDPRTPMFAAYDWLTMFQESLVRELW